MSYDPLGILNQAPPKKQSVKQVDPLGILKTEEPVKKKETLLSDIGEPAQRISETGIGSSLSKVGGFLGKLFSPSEEKKDDAPAKITVDENDPIKSFLSPFRNKAFIEKEPTQLVSESTGQKVVKPTLKTKPIIDTDKEVLKQLAPEVKKHIFPSTKSAEAWVQNKISRDGKLDPENETDKIANDIATEGGLKRDAINYSPNFEQAALKYYASKKDKLGEQLTKLNGDAPDILKGKLMYGFLNDPQVKEMSKESPETYQRYQEEKANLMNHYPEAATQMMLSELGQAKEDMGLNSSILNLNLPQTIGKVAEHLFETGKWGEKEKQFFQDVVAPQLAFGKAEIPTPGLIETGVKSAINTVKDLPKGVYQLSGLRNVLTTENDRLYDIIKEQEQKPQVNFKGFHKVSNLVGEMTGFVLPMGIEAKALQAMGAVKNISTANQIIAGTTFFKSLHDEAQKEMPGSPVKQYLLALTQAGVYGTVANVFPSHKVAEGLSREMQPAIKDVINKIASGEITDAAAKDLLATEFKQKLSRLPEYAGKVLKGNTKAAVEMTTAKFANNVLNSVFSGKPIDVAANQEDLKDTFLSMFVGNTFNSMLAARGGKPIVKDVLHEVASNPEPYKKSIDLQAASDPDLAKDAEQRKSNIDYLSIVKGALDDKGVPDKEQKTYLLHAMNDKLLSDKMKVTEEPTLKKELQEKIKRSQEVKEGVLKGTTEEHIIEKQGKELVKELYDEDLIPRGQKKLLELREEDKEPKYDEKQAKSFLKYVAQQANNLDEDGSIHKDHDSRKAAEKSFPPQLIEAANEMFPDYAKLGEEQRDITYLDENKKSEPIELNPEFTGTQPTEKVTIDAEQNIHPINYNKKTASKVNIENDFTSYNGNKIVNEKGEPLDEVTPQAESKDQGEPQTVTSEGDKVTGIKNTISRESRVKLYLPKIELPKIGSDYQRLSEGKEAVDSGEVNPQEVVDKVLAGKGKVGMHPQEAAAMQYYMHQLGTAQDLVTKQISLDIEPQEKLELISQQQQLSDLMDAATEANMLAGTAWSAVGNTRQMLVDEGFNPSREKAVIKEAYGGEIPKDVQLKIDTALKERDAAIEEKNKLEEQLKNKQAEGAVYQMKKGRTAKTDYKEKRTNLIDDLKKAKEEHEQWLKDNGIQKQGLGIPLTGKMIKIIGEIAKTYVDQGIEKLSDIIDKVHDDVKAYLVGIDKSEVRDAIAIYHAQKLETKATGLENKIASGVDADINKLKPKFQRNNQWVKANQRVANAEYKVKNLKREAFNSKKNFYQRGLNWGGKLFRASVLSGYNVLYKLAAAATIGGVGKRIPEQVIGGIWSQAFKGIAQKAPIEGFINARSEAKFYKDFFNPKKFAHNSWEIIKGNESDLSRKFGNAQYGKAGKIPLPANTPNAVKKAVSITGQVLERVLSLPTDLHQVIKDPVKRATFEASFHNGLVWAEKNGLDINDPLVINALETASYKRANYEIFMEQNWLSKKFGEFKTKMEKSGNVGATGKFVADFMIPVSTVPTNIVRRLVTTSPLGLIRGGIKVTEAYRKGIENLTNEQADAVMKQLKQGTLGTALWLIGWFGAASFGGLYSKYNPNKQRDEGDLPSDEMEINGQMIPKPVQHALPLEIIQWAATARHIYDNYRENKGESNFQSIYNAGMGSIGALAEQIPIVETGAHVVGAFNNPYEADKLEQDVKRRFEPQLLRETGIIKKDEPKSTGSRKPTKPHKHRKSKRN